MPEQSAKVRPWELDARRKDRVGTCPLPPIGGGERIPHLRTPHGERVHARTEAAQGAHFTLYERVRYGGIPAADDGDTHAAQPAPAQKAGPSLGPPVRVSRRPGTSCPSGGAARPAAPHVPQCHPPGADGEAGPMRNPHRARAPQQRRVLEDHAVDDPHHQEVGAVVHVVGADPLFEACLPPGLLGSALVVAGSCSPARGRASRVPSPHSSIPSQPIEGVSPPMSRRHADRYALAAPWTLWALTVSGVQRSRSWTSTVPPTMPARGSRANVSATQAK